MAKKSIHIELSDIRQLAALQCTEAEAASFFNISTKKFKEILSKFPDVADAWEQGKNLGKTTLRRKQLRLASTSSAMAIFLGKQMLGQKDVNTTELTGPNGGPIESTDFSSLSQDERNQLREILSKARKPASAN